MSVQKSSETIDSYGDLAANTDLSGREVDIVAGQLADVDDQPDDWLIAWVPEWLLEEKREEDGIQPVAGTETVVAGEQQRETEKAILVECDGGETWLPKSQITIFEPHTDAQIDIPQRGLGEFEHGGGA